VLFKKHIGVNLRPNGSTLDFEQCNALHCVNHSLPPMLIAALAAKVHGQDWYSVRSREGSGLRKSLDWLAVFVRGERTHVEFMNSVVPHSIRINRRYRLPCRRRNVRPDAATRDSFRQATSS
jgi:hypothetical protein